jgi:hypothetical protein
LVAFALIHIPSLHANAISGFQNGLRDTLDQKRDRSGVFPELVDRQHSVTYEIRLRGRELRENETGTIAEDDVWEVDGLEMLGLTGRRRYADFFLSDKSVDGARLADVWIADKPNNKFIGERITRTKRYTVGQSIVDGNQMRRRTCKLRSSLLE